MVVDHLKAAWKDVQAQYWTWRKGLKSPSDLAIVITVIVLCTSLGPVGYLLLVGVVVFLLLMHHPDHE